MSIDDLTSQEDEELAHREQLRTRLLTSVLLGENSKKTVELEYDGYGDSGGPGNCTLADEELIDFLWDCVEKHHHGFWNNEGGRGTVTWNLLKDEIIIDHGDAIQDHEWTVTIIDSDGNASIREPNLVAFMRTTVRECNPLYNLLKEIQASVDPHNAARLQKIL